MEGRDTQLGDALKLFHVVDELEEIETKLGRPAKTLCERKWFGDSAKVVQLSIIEPHGC